MSGGYLYFHQRLCPQESTMPFSKSKTHKSLGLDSSTFGESTDVLEPDERD